ncbi:Uncharacterised protein [uncultured archaeon]|nr:Uncharacterised protein [uncultured archaeon]
MPRRLILLPIKKTIKGNPPGKVIQLKGNQNGRKLQRAIESAEFRLNRSTFGSPKEAKFRARVEKLKSLKE